MLTNGKMERVRFTSAEGNPFKALAAEVARADHKRAEGLRKTRAAREANAKRRAAKDSGGR